MIISVIISQVPSIMPNTWQEYKWCMTNEGMNENQDLLTIVTVQDTALAPSSTKACIDRPRITQGLLREAK